MPASKKFVVNNSKSILFMAIYLLKFDREMQ